MFVSEFYLNPRSFLGLSSLDPSHIPLHFVLLHFISVDFSKWISCVSKCARELLIPMLIYIPMYIYIYKTLLYHQQMQKFSFLPIVIPLMLLFCPKFPRNISANIMYRMMDNGDLCHSRLLTRKLATSARHLDLCFYVLINCFYFLYYFGSVSEIM